MSQEKFIKVTKKNGQYSIVPAGQRPTYESFNAKYEKLKKTDQVVTIEDYEPTAADAKKAETGSGDGTGGSKVKTALELIADISNAKSPEEVDSLIPEGESRATVLKAADAKKAELAKA